MNIKKILLVDDDFDLIEQNKLILESKGFEVSVVIEVLWLLKKVLDYLKKNFQMLV